MGHGPRQKPITGKPPLGQSSPEGTLEKLRKFIRSRKRLLGRSVRYRAGEDSNCVEEAACVGAEGRLRPVNGEQSAYFVDDDRSILQGSVHKNAMFEAIEEQEDVTDAGGGIAAAACKPLQVGAARLRGDFRIGRPVGHGLPAGVGTCGINPDPRIDDVGELAIGPIGVRAWRRADIDQAAEKIEVVDAAGLTGLDPARRRHDSLACGNA